MQITIYSTTTCPFCKLEKEYLASKNITYNEKLVDADEAALKEMQADSGGFLGVPFTVVIKNDGTKESIMGFDKGKLDSIIQI